MPFHIVHCFSWCIKLVLITVMCDSKAGQASQAIFHIRSGPQHSFHVIIRCPVFCNLRRETGENVDSSVFEFELFGLNEPQKNVLLVVKSVKAYDKCPRPLTLHGSCCQRAMGSSQKRRFTKGEYFLQCFCNTFCGLCALHTLGNTHKTHIASARTTFQICALEEKQSHPVRKPWLVQALAN